MNPDSLPINSAREDPEPAPEAVPCLDITLPIEPTDNPKIQKVAGGLVTGRGQLKAALMVEAKAEIDAIADRLYPPKKRAE